LNEKDHSGDILVAYYYEKLNDYMKQTKMEILSDYAEGLINKFINENIQSKVIITKLFQLFKSLDDNFKYRSELVHESLKLFQQNVIILILL